MTASLHPDAEFVAHLSEGRFMMQRSISGQKVFFYPRVAEPGTGRIDLEWVEVSGKGKVYATTIVRQRPPKADYNVALIDLEEGPRMMSRVEGIAPEQVRIGMAVQHRIIEDDEGPAIVFDPVTTDAWADGP